MKHIRRSTITTTYTSNDTINVGTSLRDGGGGKSLLALEMALSLATGRPSLLKGGSEPETVLYLDYEMGRAKLKRRLTRMGLDLARDLPHLVYRQGLRLPSLDTEQGAEALLALVEFHKPSLVIIDTLSKAVLGEETSNTVFSRFARLSLSPLTEAGMAVLLLDHTGHSRKQRARGAAAKRDNVDLNYLLERVPKEGKHSLRVVMDKDREGSGEDDRPVVLNMHRVDEPRLHHMVPGNRLTPAVRRKLAECAEYESKFGTAPSGDKLVAEYGGSKRDASAAVSIYKEQAA